MPERGTHEYIAHWSTAVICLFTGASNDLGNNIKWGSLEQLHTIKHKLDAVNDPYLTATSDNISIPFHTQ